jgi:hypothetical protein
MASDSFFALFAQWIQPDVKRPATEGDFYGSPLRYLGIPLADAYQVNMAWMKDVKSFKDIADFSVHDKKISLNHKAA